MYAYTLRGQFYCSTVALLEFTIVFHFNYQFSHMFSLDGKYKNKSDCCLYAVGVQLNECGLHSPDSLVFILFIFFFFKCLRS